MYLYCRRCICFSVVRIVIASSEYKPLSPSWIFHNVEQSLSSSFFSVANIFHFVCYLHFVHQAFSSFTLNPQLYAGRRNSFKIFFRKKYTQLHMDIPQQQQQQQKLNAQKCFDSHFIRFS